MRYINFIRVLFPFHSFFHLIELFFFLFAFKQTVKNKIEVSKCIIIFEFIIITFGFSFFYFILYFLWYEMRNDLETISDKK